jgi:hypothetical protein
MVQRFKLGVYLQIKLRSTTTNEHTAATRVISIVAIGEIWSVAIVIVATGVVDINGSQNSSNGHF